LRRDSQAQFGLGKKPPRRNWRDLLIAVAVAASLPAAP
jgi:hypothetical protein